MKNLLLLSCFLINTYLGAQNITFKNNDDFIKVRKNDVVSIQTDTAYIISFNRAQFFNQKLDELHELKILYNSTSANRNALLVELQSLEEALERIAVNMQSDSSYIDSNLNSILLELDDTLSHLKSQNEALEKNNNALVDQIDQLRTLVKQLKKETRGLWWNGVADKLVAFGGGVLIGALLVAVL